MRALVPAVSVCVVVVGLGLAGCGDDEPEPLPVSNGMGPAPFDPGVAYAPRVAASDLSTAITNALFPAPPGARWVYEGTTEDGTERIEVSVEADTRATWGVDATIVHDVAYLNDAPVEDTRDWYAQDRDGNVWYLGEDTRDHVMGAWVPGPGAWEAGVGGALPGVAMLGAPAVGLVYRQEYAAGAAEDLASVVATRTTVTIRGETFTGCVVIRDRSALDLEADERKTYCPGVGLVLEEEEGGRIELVGRSGL